MKLSAKISLCIMLCFSLVAEVVGASEQSFGEQFLGSPLIVLAAIIILDILALIHRKFRK
jgi:hypothetical protein